MTDDVKYILILNLLCLLVAAIAILSVILLLWTRSLDKKNRQVFLALGRLRSSNRALATLDKMKSDFINGITHEFRNPLNAIRGGVELLTDPHTTLSENERDEYCELVGHNADVLSSLVDDLLDLSRMGSEDTEFSFDNVDISDLISSLAETVPADGKVRFSASSRCPVGTAVKSDAAKMRRVLRALLDNAFKFTPEGGEVDLSAEFSPTPGFLLFSVSDSGPAIPEEMAEVIFDKFKKLDPFTQGSGLGLYVARTFATLLGGSVKVDKTFAKGARFVFEVPKTPPVSAW